MFRSTIKNNNDEKQANLLSLPRDLLLWILSCLTLNDLFNLSQVSTTLRSVAMDPFVLKEVFSFEDPVGQTAIDNHKIISQTFLNLDSIPNLKNHYWHLVKNYVQDNNLIRDELNAGQSYTALFFNYFSGANDADIKKVLLGNFDVKFVEKMMESGNAKALSGYLKCYRDNNYDFCQKATVKPYNNPTISSWLLATALNHPNYKNLSFFKMILRLLPITAFNAKELKSVTLAFCYMNEADYRYETRSRFDFKCSELQETIPIYAEHLKWNISCRRHEKQKYVLLSMVDFIISFYDGSDRLFLLRKFCDTLNNDGKIMVGFERDKYSENFANPFLLLYAQYKAEQLTKEELMEIIRILLRSFVGSTIVYYLNNTLSSSERSVFSSSLLSEEARAEYESEVKPFLYLFFKSLICDSEDMLSFARSLAWFKQELYHQLMDCFFDAVDVSEEVHVEMFWRYLTIRHGKDPFISHSSNKHSCFRVLPPLSQKDRKDKDGNTWLHLLFEMSFFDEARKLIKLGFDFNATNDLEKTPAQILKFIPTEICLLMQSKQKECSETKLQQLNTKLKKLKFENSQLKRNNTFFKEGSNTNEEEPIGMGQVPSELYKIVKQ